MRQWTDLTPDEQRRVRLQERLRYTKALVEVGPTLIGEEDHPVRLQFEQLSAHMNRMQTPWFLFECVYNDLVCKSWINDQVDDYLTEAYFLDPGEIALSVPVARKEGTS